MKILILLIVTLINIYLAFYIYLKNRKSKINKTCAVLISGVIFWCLSNIACLAIVKNYKFAWLWSEIGYISAIVIANALFYFSCIFPYGNILIKQKRILYLFNYLILIVLLWPNFTIKNVDIVNWRIITGPGLIIFGVYFLFLMLWSFYNFIRKFKKSFGINKVQLQYILMGMFLSFLFGSIFNLLFPLFNNYNFIWLGPVFTIFMIFAISYAILKYRFMNIKVVIRKNTIRIGSVLILLAIIIPLNFLIVKFLPENRRIFANIAIVFFIITFYYRIKEWLSSFINKHFFTSLYDERKLLAKISQDLQNILNKDELLKYIAKIIGDAFHSSNIIITVKNGLKFVVEFSTIPNSDYQKNVVLENENISEFLEGKFSIFVFDEVCKNSREKFSEVLDRMKINKIELIIPLKSKNNLIGSLFLGEKYNKESYSKEDIQILEIISRQFAIALKNALLYQEVQDFNELLGQKIKEQTKDLQEKNIELNKLLNMRTEFLNIASHQLRTPVSIIQGIASILSNKNYSIDLEERQEMLQDILYGTNKMKYIIDNILRAASYDTDKNFSLNLLLEKVSLNKCANKTIKDLRTPAKEKNILVKFKYPKKLPNVKSNESYLCQIIANLLDNAIIYTIEGGRIEIILSFDEKSNKVKFQIKDSGIGISKEELPNIFDKFTRGSNAFSVNANGSGLGLFIVKQLINAHPGGEIGIESEIGKGTEVWFELGAAN